MNLTIGYLYGDLMNTYGDSGNVICLKKRCQWREIEVKIKQLTIGDKIKKGDVDLYFFGGGQDQNQIEVATDLVSDSKKKVLQEEIERGVPLLAICGGYQLLGEYYQPFNARKIYGLGVLPVFTNASHDRMVGNLVISSKTFGDLIGFENHSGKTYLKSSAQTLGRVIKGFGNNGEDQTEGCLYKNIIGCYMHGSLLPKNPKLADWLIKKALEVKYGKEIKLEVIDDRLELQAQQAAISKFS